MDVRRALIVVGLAIAAAGFLWPWMSRLPFGRLPGDITIHRDNFSLFFPLATSLIVSVVLTLLFWLLRK